jgi:hypothetical protein
MKHILLLSLLLLGACGVDPAKIAGHELYADDGQQLKAPRTLTFAVVGNTFGVLQQAEDDKQQTEAGRISISERLVEDLAAQMRHERYAFLVLMGDLVGGSSNKSWAAFDLAWRNLLKGESEPESPRIRMPVVPVVGEREFRGDRFLQGFGAAFPGVGAPIGYNRVAGWYAFDAQVRDAKWRFVKEQLYWIPRAVGGGDYEHLVVFMHHPLLSLVPEGDPNSGGAPAELLELVEDSIGLMKLRAVFMADPGTSEAFLVGGRFGTLHLNAGGGGGLADDLQRWGHVRAAGVEATQLEPMFDVALLNTFNSRAREHDFPEVAIDAARAEGSYDGFPGLYDASWYPTHGYWWVEIQGGELDVIYRIYDGHSGSFADIYRMAYTDKDGWRTGS